MSDVLKSRMSCHFNCFTFFVYHNMCAVRCVRRLPQNAGHVLYGTGSDQTPKDMKDRTGRDIRSKRDVRLNSPGEGGERERERDCRRRISGNPAVRVYSCRRSSNQVVIIQCTGHRLAARARLLGLPKGLPTLGRGISRQLKLPRAGRVLWDCKGGDTSAEFAC